MPPRFQTWAERIAYFERHGYRLIDERPNRPRPFVRPRFVLKLWHVVTTLLLALVMAASGIAVVIVGVLWLWRAMW